MPRQSNGNYLQPANTAAVSGTTISSTADNTLITDIGTEITNSLDRGGRSAMTAALPMGAQKITGMAEPTVSTDAATKNYVDTTTAAFFSTGDVKPTFKIVADTGWLMMDDTSIGPVGSAAAHNFNALLALYTLLWTNISSPSSNAWCAVTGGLGVSAAADWAGLKPLAIPKALGRVFVGAGGGSGLTSRILGTSVGLETTTLAANNIPTLVSVNASQAISVTSANTYPNSGATANTILQGAGTPSNLWVPNSVVGPAGIVSSGNNSISTTYTNGSPAAFNIVQPGTWANFMIKY